MVNDKALELVDRCDRTLFERQWDVAGFVVKMGTLKFCFSEKISLASQWQIYKLVNKAGDV